MINKNNGGILLDPRQAMAKALYTDPKSDTFGNLKQSLISAGYDKAYAHSIHGRNPKWLTTNMKDQVIMVRQAERNFKKYISLDIDTNDKSKGNIDFAKIQVDVSKFVAKNLAKGKYNNDNDNDDKGNVKIVIKKLIGDNVTDVEVEQDDKVIDIE